MTDQPVQQSVTYLVVPDGWKPGDLAGLPKTRDQALSEQAYWARYCPPAPRVVKAVTTYTTVEDSDDGG